MHSAARMVGFGEFIFGAIAEGVLHILGWLGFSWSRNSRIKGAIYIGILGFPLGAVFAYFGLQSLLYDFIPKGEIGKSFTTALIALFGIALVSLPFLVFFFGRDREQK